MVHTTVNTGDLSDVTNQWHTSSGGDKRAGNDNHYIDWINDMRVQFYQEADYGVDWAGTGSGVDVETTLPSSPSGGAPHARVNTNAESGNLRVYRWNGHTNTWKFNEYRGAISVTTRITGITTVAAGTEITYGTTAARTKHAMSIKGNLNGGSIEEIEVEFQTRLHASDDFVTAFSLLISDFSSDSASVSNFIEMNAAEVRYNVLSFQKTGSPNIDVTITSN